MAAVVVASRAAFRAAAVVRLILVEVFRDSISAVAAAADAPMRRRLTHLRGPP